MNKELEEKCKKLEKECESIGLESSKIINDKLLLEIENEFLQRFGFKLSTEDWKIKFSEMKMPIKNILIKLFRHKRTCVVFGEPAVGKSSLINALLKMDLLKADFGATSNCFVEIKPTNETQSYIEINEQRQPLEDLFQLNDFNKGTKLPDGSHIDAFINKEKSPFLQEDFVLIDTPGINHLKLMDIAVEKYAVDADVVILVINSTSIITDTIKSFLNKFKNQVSKLNFFIVFNYWDIPGNRSNRQEVKLRFLNEARELLCSVSSYNNMEAEERIFFLCSHEQILLNNNDHEAVWRNLNWEERKDSFTKFKETFNTKMIENSLHRKRRYLNQLHSQVSKCLKEYENSIQFIRREIPGFAEQIRNVLGKITNLEEKIKSNAAKIFENTSSAFIAKARAIETKYDQNKSDERQKKELVEQIFDFSKELIHGGIEEFKNAIKNLIQDNLESTDKCREMLIKIVENIYFPMYIDTYKIPESFMENILDINKKIKKSSILKCGLCVFSAPIVAIPLILARQNEVKMMLLAGAAMFSNVITTDVVSGLFAGAVMFPNVITPVVVSGSFAGAAIFSNVITQCIVSGILADPLHLAAEATERFINYINDSFEFVWIGDAKPIQTYVDALRDELSQSYPNFIKEIHRNLENILESLDKTQLLQNECNNLTNEVGEFNRKCDEIEIYPE